MNDFASQLAAENIKRKRKKKKKACLEPGIFLSDLTSKGERGKGKKTLGKENNRHYKISNFSFFQYSFSKRDFHH